MDLEFERGDPGAPRGHALVYFRDTADPAAVAATYLILLPVTVDLQKYVPPFLAGQMPLGDEADLSAFAFPPAPEPVNSYEHLLSLVEARDDDLIFGGRRALSDAAMLMGVVGEVLGEYSERYRNLQSQIETPEQPDETPAAEADTVDDVVYAMMSEADQLNELTRLTGRLRFAAEGGDDETVGDATAHMKAIALHVAENRRIDRLIDAARDRSDEGGRLAQLYLERAYALYREDYLRVKALDEQIGAVRPEE